MNNTHAAWQMIDELVELTAKADRRAVRAEKYLMDAQIACVNATDTAEKLQELLNKILRDDE